MDGFLWHAGKVVIAAVVISFTSWLCGKKPEWAGLLVALPLTSMLALAFSFTEYKDPVKSVQFAKSILAAVPLSLLFFLPFVFADKLRLSFWAHYALGLILLVMGYYGHRFIMKSLL